MIISPNQPPVARRALAAVKCVNDDLKRRLHHWFQQHDLNAGVDFVQNNHTAWPFITVCSLDVNEEFAMVKYCLHGGNAIHTSIVQLPLSCESQNISCESCNTDDLSEGWPWLMQI